MTMDGISPLWHFNEREKKQYNPNWYIETLDILIYLLMFRTIDNNQMEEKLRAIYNAVISTIAISLFRWAMRSLDAESK